MKMLFKFQVNQMKIEDLRKFGPNWPILTFWLKLTSKFIGGWIQWPDMQMLFKFQVNWIKIEDFRNLAYVDLFVYVDLFTNGDHKNNKWLLSVIWYVNHFQISTQSDENWGFRKFGPNWPFGLFWPFGLCLPQN